jgi:hypothetical protein
MFRVKEPHPRLFRSEILVASFALGDLRDRIAKRCFIFPEGSVEEGKAGRLTYTEEAKRTHCVLAGVRSGIKIKSQNSQKKTNCWSVWAATADCPSGFPERFTQTN